MPLQTTVWCGARDVRRVVRRQRDIYIIGRFRVLVRIPVDDADFRLSSDTLRYSFIFMSVAIPRSKQSHLLKLPMERKICVFVPIAPAVHRSFLYVPGGSVTRTADRSRAETH